MCNLELEIGRRFRGSVLRVHPLVLRILTAVVAVGREQMGVRAEENAHPNECSFPANLRAPAYSPKLKRSQICADKTRAECRQIKNDHDEREEIHPHGETNPEVHRTNANRPKFRVLVFQIKNGYPISNSEIKIRATGKRYFHVMKISGSMMLKGGRMGARHTFEPSQYPLPKHFVKG